jgi:hypothetical protein
MLQVQIAVPGELEERPDEEIDSFLWRGLESAVGAASDFVRRRDLEWPMDEAQAVVAAVRPA